MLSHMDNQAYSVPQVITKQSRMLIEECLYNIMSYELSREAKQEFSMVLVASKVSVKQ